MDRREITLNEISDIINAKYEGKNIILNGLIKELNRDSEYESLLTFCGNEQFVKKAMKNTKIKAIITNEKAIKKIDNLSDRLSYIIVENPESSFFYLHNYLYESTNFYNEFDFPRKIGKNCRIHTSAIIEDGVEIGENVTVGANVVIKKGSILEDNVTIKDNSVVGADCLEIKWINNKYEFVKHVGGTKIGKSSYIGSNTIVGRNLFEGFCVIGSETFIDNIVHIAHNNIIGNNNIITTGVFTAGSVTIGNNCFIGVGARISNFVKIGNHVKINIGSVVVENVRNNQIVAGHYAMPNDAWLLKTINDKKKYKIRK